MQLNRGRLLLNYERLPPPIPPLKLTLRVWCAPSTGWGVEARVLRERALILVKPQ